MLGTTAGTYVANWVVHLLAAILKVVAKQTRLILICAAH